MTRGPARLLLMALLALTAPAAAEESSLDELDVIEISEASTPEIEAPELRPEQRIVVVSGGISRGSYQAGQLWAVLEYLKREARYREAQGLPPTELTLVGASAGSINAMIAAAAVLMESVWPVDRPLERSPFYRAWVPEGFHGSPHSLDHWPEGVEPEALIRDDFLEESVSGIGADLRKPGHLPAWRGPVRVAMTATRLVADTGPSGVSRDLNESFGFEVSRSALGTVVVRPLRLSCPGDPAPRPGAASRLRCEVDEAIARPMTDEAGAPLTVPWEVAGGLIEASSAVPLAFKPYSLPCATYLTLSLWPKPSCYADGSDAALQLVDGGVLDGHPFRVGDRVSRAPHEGARSRFFFLDPDMDGSRPTPPPAESTAEQTLRFFSQVVPSARAQSVTQFLQDHPHLSSEATVFEARSAPIGNYLGGFLAFYDHSFRTWDFYAGVHDGYLNVVAEVEASYGVDCSDHGLETGRASAAACEALLPALSQRASPGFHATHEVLTAYESGVLDGADWPALARFVDEVFARVEPEELAEAAHVHELGGAAKDYDPLVLLRNLRMLALLVGTRAIDAEGLGEGYDFEWLSTRLSSVMPCPSEAGCAPFWFVPLDLGGELPLAGVQRMSEAWGRRLGTRWEAGFNPERLADTFTLRQDGAFSVLFRRRVNWQLSRIHRYELLGDGALARTVPRAARVVLTGPNRLFSWGAGTPTVIDAAGAFGLGWDAWRVRPWSAFGRSVRLPWVYGGFRLYGNPVRWWPGAHPNALLSARAGFVAFQLRGGDRRLWLWDAPITPAAGPLFPLTLEVGVLAQGIWVYHGVESSLLIQPRWVSGAFPSFAATPALEARLMVLGWVSIAGEWHAFTRDFQAGAGAEGDNPELRFVVSLTRPGLVRRRPFGSDWR
ncbi:MAG: patatin-like phospholipase family protein [Alphaproteobacteria bacterium]|nr:patatin-like phospholipase family protein [Alphaproteobacteria bacterium]